MVVDYVSELINTFKKSKNLSLIHESQYFSSFESLKTGETTCIHYTKGVLVEEYLKISVDNKYQLNFSSHHAEKLNKKSSGVLLHLAVYGIDANKSIRDIVDYYNKRLGFDNYTFEVYVDTYYYMPVYFMRDPHSYANFNGEFRCSCFEGLDFTYDLGILSFNELKEFNINTLWKCFNLSATEMSIDEIHIENPIFYRECDAERNIEFTKKMVLSLHKEFIWNEYKIYAFQ